MGNENGLMDAMAQQGMNKCVDFDGGYFSFAFGSEIALVLKDIGGYFTLNCGEELLTKVKAEIAKGKTTQELVTWWINQSEDYEVNDYSDDFEDLK